MSAAQGCNCFTLTEIPCGLSAPKWRTVRRIILPTPELSISLDKLQPKRQTVRSPLADRPQHSYPTPPRGNNVSGTNSNPPSGPSGHPWRTVRSSRNPFTRDDNVSGQTPSLYCGLSAPKRRTVRSSPLRTSRDDIVSGTNSSLNGGPSAPL